MNTRSSMRTRRTVATASPALADTPTQKSKKTKVLNKLNQDSSKLNSSSTPEKKNTLESFLGTTPQKITYPDLGGIQKALSSSFNLYPSLENSGTPSQRRRSKGASSTARKSASRRSLIGQDVEMQTPSKTTEPFVPKSSVFDFKFSSGLEEVGRRIMEELKLSSVAVQAKILEDGQPDAPVTNSQTDSTISAPGKTTTRSRRFSDAHKQQFNKMSSIADHYAAKRAKNQPTASASGSNVFGNPKTPKTLKRKGRAEELASPMKMSPSKASVTSDGEPELDDSPIPASKKTKFDGTPYTKKTGGLLQPGTPFLPGAIHGISRSVSVKEAAKKQSSLPRLVRKDGHPATPSKPIAVATPVKEVTLLASPSKHRLPATAMKNNSDSIQQPGTPSPVKSSVPINVEGFSFRNNGPAPRFPDLNKLPDLSKTLAKPSVKWADIKEPPQKPLEPRALFDGVVIEPSAQAKRKVSATKSAAANSADEEDFSTATTPASKRLRAMPELGLSMMGTLPSSTPCKAPPPKPIFPKLTSARGVSSSRLDELATPKKRATPYSRPTAVPKSAQKPRWK